MYMGNFCLLTNKNPYDVYEWFTICFIDSYDWVMVPNVYGMTQFADGGLMTTKPYISGSNYLMKMSDFKKGDWQPIWDGLFWRFLDKQRETFRKNPRWAMLISTWDKPCFSMSSKSTPSGGGGVFMDRSRMAFNSTFGAATYVPRAPRPSSRLRRRASS